MTQRRRATEYLKAERQAPEPDGTRAGIVLAFAAAIAVVVVLSVPLADIVLHVYRGPDRLQPIDAGERDGVTRHWTNPAGELAAMRAAEDERLTTYQWIDRGAGVVRIPIERAMRLVVAEADDESRHSNER